MAEQTLGEKTEKATPRKKQEARKKGNIASSKEINSVMILLAGVMGLKFFGGNILNSVMFSMRWFFSRLSEIEVTQTTVSSFSISGVKFVGLLLAPLVSILVLTAFGASAIQGGIVFASEPIKPKLSKISPLAGIKRIFSSKSLVELGKGLFKMIVVALIGYSTLKAHWSEMQLLVDQDISMVIRFIGTVAYKLAVRIGVAMILMAVIDYVYQKFDHAKNLKMTKQEVKEEFKSAEGDPLIKSRIRSIQMKMARQRMMKDVADATVVVTNPTHFAVALKYNPDKMKAPLVVAKGARLLALKIKEIAAEHHVPMVENKPLAQILYKTVDVGAPIPLDLYKAVAEILAYVYRLRSAVNQTA